MSALASYFQSVRLSLNRRYDPIFNFYMAKDISDICHSRPHSKQVIDFQDFLRLDCEDEMLKRYYQLNQVARINMLAEYYTRNRVLEIDSPALYLTSGGKHMHKRLKRRIKRQEHRREQDEDYAYEGKSTFLKSINSSDLHKSDEDLDLLGDISMGTTVFDIYEEEITGMTERKDSLQTAKLFKNMFSLKNEESDDQEEEVALDNLVIDFNALDHERILKEYNLLKNMNPQKIPAEKADRKSIKKPGIQSIENKNTTLLKMPEPKIKESGKAYLVKGLPSSKKYVRLDEQYLEQFGKEKQRNFIKEFQTEIEGGWKSPKAKSGHLRIYSPDQPYQKFHQLRYKNRQSEYLRSPNKNREHYYEMHSKSPLIDERLQRIHTISDESKWRTKQYQALKQKAEEVEQQALKTIYRFSNKKIRSNDYILPSHRER